ncbi:MAG: hypothetical protein R3F62_17265 [Planctomycetota bacterium]
MSDLREHPEPPPERDPESQEGDSERFYVVVEGSAEEELPEATASEGELAPTSARLPLLDDEPRFGDEAADEDDGLGEEPSFDEDDADPRFESSVMELDDDPELQRLLDEEPEFQSQADEAPEFQSEVEGLDDPFEDDASDTSDLELLELHPEAEDDSPFAPLEERPRATPPRPEPNLAPLRHGRRRDEYFSGELAYEGPGKEAPPPRQPRDHRGHAPEGGLGTVDAEALPAYVVEQLERRRGERARHEVEAEAARRAQIRQVAIVLAVAFVVGGQLHGWLTLLSGSAIYLLPVDAALGAVAGYVLAQAPDTVRGQLLVGGAAALAMGAKFAWALSGGALDGIALLFAFVLSVGLMFGAVIGGGVLGLSLEQRIVE